MFKILFGFVIIGLINCADLRFKREGNSYETSEEQDPILEQLESKYTDYMTSEQNNNMETESYGQENQHSSPVSAAIKTKRYHRVIPTKSTDEEASPHVIEINPYRQPFHFVFKTQSNPLSVEQIHSSLPGHTENTESEDEPHRVMHKVFRPVIQEIKEIIQPYRRIRQEIRPVLEEVRTTVHQNEMSSGEGSRKRGESYASRGDSGSQKMSYGKPQQLEQRTKNSEQTSGYDMDLAKDYSNRKGTYLPGDESTEQKTRDLIKERQTASEVLYNRRTRYQSDSDSTEQKPREVKRERPYTSEDYSNRKTRYQSENESTEQLLKALKKEKQLIPEVKSILEQMNSILAGDRLKAKTPEVQQQALQHQAMASNVHRHTLTPILSLNSGRVKILGWSDGPIYSQ